MLDYLNQFTRHRGAWLLLAGGALFLELCALFFQYVLKLSPCEMCVYERAAVLGILLAGLIGAIAPRFFAIRWIGFLLWGYSAFRGLQLALEHVQIQLHPSPFQVCSLFAQFPSWMPLEKIAPWMFTPLGSCTEIDWQFLGLTMPQWMVGIFALFLALFFIFGLLQFKRKACNSCCNCN
ncbi:disulfide bond formation protein DsbB [Dongshaea marina]|uniref:disulfide bond formation protein DsbB n=1 Tax=Dongshaea marina TaxID=2047966 RepID=UPI000D3E56C4|nr:disulfide bond formation protein DsbB [Dongshaea marina]